MLHDLYLISCYFDPAAALQYEDELMKKYGEDAVTTALRDGLIERSCIPCARGPKRFYCRLSSSGLNAVTAAA